MKDTSDCFTLSVFDILINNEAFRDQMRKQDMLYGSYTAVGEEVHCKGAPQSQTYDTSYVLVFVTSEKTERSAGAVEKWQIEKQ